MKAPKKEQLHAQKITHRDRAGKFKSPPPAIAKRKLHPAELAQDSGQGYRPENDAAQDEVFPQT